MAVRMIALKPLICGNKRIKPGQEFNAPGRLQSPFSEATTLRALGLAKEAPAVELPAPAPQPANAVPAHRTRMMTAEPPAPAIAPVPEIVTKTDDLDGMDVDALHELARSRGVYVHHRAGADRVRQALRDAQPPDSSAE